MKNKESNIVKFKWEKDHEYNYRINVSKLSINVSNILNTFVSLANQANPNYLPALNSMQSIYGEYTKLIEPDIYFEFHTVYRQGLEYYIKGLTLLVSTFREKKEKKLANNDKGLISKVVKASTLIDAAACYLKISNVKNMELFEKQQKEFNERGGIIINEYK